MLVLALSPGAAAPYDLAAREPFPAQLAPEPSGDSFSPANRTHRLQLLLGVDTDATGGPASGSPSVSVGILYLRSIAGSVAYLGAGLGYYRALSQGTGSATVGGGAAQLLLTPRLISVPVVLKLGLGSRILATLEPALVVGWVSATVAHSSSSFFDTSSSPGVGAQLSTGLEMQFTDRLGLAMRVGFRALTPSLTVTPLARPGEPLGPQSQNVDVSLTGIFWNAGLVIQL